MREFRTLKLFSQQVVNSEWSFSAAGQLCTKIPSRLCDSTHDSLCFLRAYFKKGNDLYITIPTEYKIAGKYFSVYKYQRIDFFNFVYLLFYI